MGKPRGLYTPVYQSLPTHRKTVRASTALKCHRLKLVGHLIALWTWSLDNMSEVGGPLSAGEVAIAAEWSERDADRFAEALYGCGFLDHQEDGYYLHEWDEYGGKVALTAAKDAARKRGGSVEIPRNGVGIPTLDETRREEDEKKTRKEKELEPEQRAHLITKYAAYASSDRVNETIDLALAHVAASKTKRLDLYVNNWLRKEFIDNARPQRSRPTFNNDAESRHHGPYEKVVKRG